MAKKINTIAVQHPNSLSVAEILSIANSAVQGDSPAVVASLPISETHQATALSYIGLGELGLAIATQITSAIAAAHAAKTTPPAVAPKPLG